MAVVTNHLVVRGSYRSLSLVIYGNTAEDLGQFNIEFDDNSLRNLVGSAEGKLEDLPLALHSTNLTIEESISSLNALSIPVAPLDIAIEVKRFLQLLFKILELSNLGDAVHEVVSTVVSASSSFVTSELHYAADSENNLTWGKSKSGEELHGVIGEAREELLQLYKVFQHELGNGFADLSAECTFLDFEADLVNSKELVDMFSQYFNFRGDSSNLGHHQLSQKENVVLGLSVALFLCSGRESCFHFVNSGGMEQLAHIFCHDKPNSTSTTLLLLGVLEQATRYSIGCEGFFGWWPREDENVPNGTSEGYSQLLKLLLQKPRHDVASLATYVLHRLRFYEFASRYECAVLSVLGGLSAVGRVAGVTLNMLINAKSQLKRLLKLINSHGPIEDPSPVARASRSLILGQTEGLLSYKATSTLIASSNCCFSNFDIDLHLLELLKERGFLALSAALLSSSTLRSEVGHAMNAFVDIASSIEAIIFSLLSCRSGLIFLLNHPELSATVINALRGGHDANKEEFLPLRYASVLISKRFFFSPQEVGMIVGVHLRVVNAIDRLLTSTPNSEEFLWLLWELCGLSRSDCGQQALLALGYFPEAVSVLIEALHSVKESEPDAKISGVLPLNLAISHSAAEILEVIVTDSTAFSLSSWIGHALEIHRALLSSSPGSNRKDAPTRLLEWIDAGVVYHKNGATGLLRYAAVLASGGDAHLTSTSILVSDLTDVENAVGDSSGGSDINVMETLGKFISEKSFDGVTLRDSSVAQLTTAFRILAFISENSTVAAALYDEGAIAVIYAVLVSCRFMLERSSNNYDYLVDEGTECNSTSDLLLERNREQSLVDLLVPSLVLLINLLQKLQEAKEQHRNTKLMNALLRLHREVSPKLAACAADLSSPYPDSALGFGAVCHLIVSALACWPVYGWIPGLFNTLLASVHAASLLALGPKETCSLLCLLNDLFPEEGIWLWKNGMPLLSAFRTLAIGTLLGPQKERQVNWYLEPAHLEKLLSQLMPQLDKLAQIIQHYAISALVVIQDMLRVLIIRIACQNAENACVLLRPILSWIRDCVSESSSPSDMEAYKVYRFLDFLAGLMEHPCGKALLLKEGAVQILIQMLERGFDSIDLDAKQILDGKSSAKCGFTSLSWCTPVFKSISLLCNARTARQYPGRPNLCKFENLSPEDCLLILCYLLKFSLVLPVGKELLACLTAFSEIGSRNEGRSALAAISIHIQSAIQEPELGRRHERDAIYDLLSEFEWRNSPPLLCCWKKLFSSVDIKDLSTYAIEAVDALSLGALHFCTDGKSLNLDSVVALKYLFGLPDDTHGTGGFSEENINYIKELITLLGSNITADDHVAASVMDTTLHRVTESAKSLLLLLQKPTGSVKVEDILSSKGVLLLSNDVLVSSKIHRMTDGIAEKDDDYLCLGGLGDKFLWECPDDRSSQTALPGKRKVSSVDGLSKRARGENSPAEILAQGAFSRGSGPSNAPSGSTRRDNFRGRKPNTSRPPSMHVDDYVARERSIDNTSNSNVISIPRIGSTGGRPPSIHVDKFMALERERQNPVAAVVGDAAAQVKNVAPENGTDVEKFKSKQLKTELDDDLQGIDIVFDGEESESDDKLPFPQPDDNLQQPAPVIVDQSSPHSIVEETESDIHESSQFSHMGTPITSNVDENTQSEFSSRMSVSRPEMRLTRESSVSSDKKYLEQSDETKNVFPVKTSNRFDSAAATSSSGFPASVYNSASASSVQLPVEPRITPQNMYLKNSPHTAVNVPVATGSQGLYDQRFPPNQPPLPPMPPPPTISPVISQASDLVQSQSSLFINPVTDVQQSLPMAFQVLSDYLPFNNSSTSLASSLPMPDSKYSRSSISSPRSARPPPLPPTPPPFSSSPYNLPSMKTSTSSSSPYNPTIAGTSSYPPPPLMSSLGFNRPASNPMTLYGSTPNQQLGENPPSILQSLTIPQPSMPSIHSIAQLQPLQPPQLPRPPQPPQHPRPPIKASQQLEQGASLQNQIQMQMHPLQMLQHSQMSSITTYYQSQQQEFSHAQQQRQIEHAQQQVLHQQGEVAIQQQTDSGMSLHEYFKSPEAIQSLLSDRDKLCQLLEQHPKLMQMLQERLGGQL
ncbi:protein virilizer homolog isoform X3 [Corylus avellana]|uniref:protein virilizer homolog isoform X3 n=1 Tax=Corylus avellana TaxID=13451 RepID=UPI00286A8C5F|nr:protein virilizer homolog isoform X3 [Corylus avellana]